MPKRSTVLPPIPPVPLKKPAAGIKPIPPVPVIKPGQSPTLTRRLAEAEAKLATLEEELPAAEAWQVELEARHASLLDDSVAFGKPAGATDAATRMQLQADIRRK